MQKYALTMQQYALPNIRNMHRYANKKYATYVHNKLKYAEICKKQNMHTYANIHFQNMHKYVIYMHKYALYA